MDRNEFMNRLKKRLKRLPSDEYNDAIEYYEQYFDDCDNEKEAIERLGTPESAATKILTDYVNNTEKQNAGFKIWLVILSIFAAPIALPLAFGLGITAIAIIFAIIVVIFSFSIAAISIVISGIVGAVLSFVFLTNSPATVIFFTGVGLFCAGLGISIWSFSIWLSKKGAQAFLNIWSRILRRSVK